MLPLEHPLLGVAAVDAQATLSTGPEIDTIPSERFVRLLSHLFRPFPAIQRLVPFGPGKALYGTADVPRSTLQVLQVVDPDEPTETSYPDDFHAFRDGPAGPVVFPNPVTVRFEGVTPVVALRSSTETVVIGISEELLADLDADGDRSDLLLSATDLPSGQTTNTGQAIAQVAASPARPVVAVSGDVAAFFESEALSGYADLNGDGAVDDLVTRVHEAAVPLNPGVPVDTTSAPERAIDGSPLAISQGFVFFRTPEAATAPVSTSRVSESHLAVRRSHAIPLVNPPFGGCDAPLWGLVGAGSEESSRRPRIGAPQASRRRRTVITWRPREGSGPRRTLRSPGSDARSSSTRVVR